MGARDTKTVRKIMQSIRQADGRATKPYDTQATVTRVEGNTAYVHIPGGVRETPVELTINAKAGDQVQVRVTGGRTFLVGNGSAPPTDNTYARSVGANLAESVTETNRVIRAVQSAVNAVRKIAANTNQYFWHTETGTDTGAHITEIPQDEFLADPENGGGNLLARSNGIAVRDGLAELATFGAGEIELTDGTDTIFQAIASEGAGGTSTTTFTQMIGPDSYMHAYITAYLQDVLEGTPITVRLQINDGTGNYKEHTFTRLAEPGTTTFSVTQASGGTKDYYMAYRSSKYVDIGYITGQGLGINTENIEAKYYKSIVGPFFTMGQRQDGYDNAAFSVACGQGLINDKTGAFVIGAFNKEPEYKDAFVIGNGESDSTRSNALKVDWDGNLNIAGKINLSGGTNPLLRGYAVTTPATTIPGNSGALCQTTFTMPSPYTHVIGVRQVSSNHGVATGINTFGVDGDGASGNTITCHAYVRNYNQSAITDETVTFELFLASL